MPILQSCSIKAIGAPGNAECQIAAAPASPAPTSAMGGSPDTSSNSNEVEGFLQGAE